MKLFANPTPRPDTLDQIGWSGFIYPGLMGVRLSFYPKPLDQHERPFPIAPSDKSVIIRKLVPRTSWRREITLNPSHLSSLNIRSRSLTEKLGVHLNTPVPYIRRNVRQ